jgi:peroxiredoxin
MNKAALYSTIAMLPVLGFAPLQAQSQPMTKASPQSKPASKMDTKPLDKPLVVGDVFPDFKIEDAAGGTHSLSTLLESGPVVLTFYRGSWCPYCVSELTAIQKQLSKITETGATVLAISPEVPSETADLVEQKKLGFLFGTDHDNELATRLALSFKLDAKTIKRYKEYGIDLPKSNDSKVWQLPVPATYIIDTDGTITFAYVDEDYSKRADYKKVVKQLQALQDG